MYCGAVIAVVVVTCVSVHGTAALQRRQTTDLGTKPTSNDHREKPVDSNFSQLAQYFRAISKTRRSLVNVRAAPQWESVSNIRRSPLINRAYTSSYPSPLRSDVILSGDDDSTTGNRLRDEFLRSERHYDSDDDATYLQNDCKLWCASSKADDVTAEYGSRLCSLSDCNSPTSTSSENDGEDQSLEDMNRKMSALVSESVARKRQYNSLGKLLRLHRFGGLEKLSRASGANTNSHISAARGRYKKQNGKETMISAVGDSGNADVADISMMPQIRQADDTQGQGRNWRNNMMRVWGR